MTTKILPPAVLGRVFQPIYDKAQAAMLAAYANCGKAKHAARTALPYLRYLALFCAGVYALSLGSRTFTHLGAAAQGLQSIHSMVRLVTGHSLVETAFGAFAKSALQLIPAVGVGSGVLSFLFQADQGEVDQLRDENQKLKAANRQLLDQQDDRRAQVAHAEVNQQAAVAVAAQAVVVSHCNAQQNALLDAERGLVEQRCAEYQQAMLQLRNQLDESQQNNLQFAERNSVLTQRMAAVSEGMRQLETYISAALADSEVGLNGSAEESQAVFSRIQHNFKIFQQVAHQLQQGAQS